MQPFGRNGYGPKIGGGLCPFGGGGAGSPSNTMLLVGYLPAKWHLDPSSRLDTTDMGQKLGALSPFWREGQLGPHLAQYGQGQDLPVCQVSS